MYVYSRDVCVCVCAHACVCVCVHACMLVRELCVSVCVHECDLDMCVLCVATVPHGVGPPIQMLMSFVYFASILSEAITLGRPKKPSRPGLLLRLYYLLKQIFDKVMNALCCGCCVSSDDD